MCTGRQRQRRVPQDSWKGTGRFHQLPHQFPTDVCFYEGLLQGQFRWRLICSHSRGDQCGQFKLAAKCLSAHCHSVFPGHTLSQEERNLGRGSLRLVTWSVWSWSWQSSILFVSLGNWPEVLGARMDTATPDTTKAPKVGFPEAWASSSPKTAREAVLVLFLWSQSIEPAGLALFTRLLHCWVIVGGNEVTSSGSLYCPASHRLFTKPPGVLTDVFTFLIGITNPIYTRVSLLTCPGEVWVQTVPQLWEEHLKNGLNSNTNLSLTWASAHNFSVLLSYCATLSVLLWLVITCIQCQPSTTQFQCSWEGTGFLRTNFYPQFHLKNQILRVAVSGK